MNLWGLLYDGATWEFSGEDGCSVDKIAWLLLQPMPPLLFRTITYKKAPGPAYLHLKQLRS